MKTMVLLNPTAGGGRAGRDAPSLLSRLPMALDVRQTVGPGHARALTEEARHRGVNSFIAVGGDGTLHEVINGALSAGEGRPSVGILPLGTGNSFARDLGIHKVPEAMKALQGPKTQVVDAVQIEHDGEPIWSINIVGFGFSASAGSLMNRRFKRLGVPGYLLAVLVELGRLHAPHYRYRLGEGGWLDGSLTMLSVCNSQFTGGDMWMAPAADVSDGRLDVIAIGKMSRRTFLRAFPSLFKGTHVQHRDISATTAEVVHFDLPGPVEVMIDGEVETLSVRTLRCHPGVLEVPCL